MVLLSRGDGWLQFEVERPIVISHVRFRGSWANRQALELRDRWTGPAYNTMVFSEIVGYLKRLPPLWRDELPATMGMPECALASVLTALHEEATGRRTASTLDGDGLNGYLRSMVHRPTDLDAFAEDLGISRATLCRRARDLLGESIQQAHEAIRLDHAADLLTNGDLPIAGVARNCGYEDQRYFSSRFRRRFGCSASAFRRRVRL